jgi:hypothetical protein
VYLDADSIVLSNIKEIWSELNKMEKTDKLMGFAPEHEVPGDGCYNLHSKIPYYGARGKSLFFRNNAQKKYI